MWLMPILWVLIVLTALLGGPWLADEIVRAALASAARRWRPRPGRRLRDVLVVVPARAEGASVRETLTSVGAAGGAGVRVRALLLLDGADAAAAAVAAGLGATVLVKEPAGPSKAAALAWLAREHPEIVRAAEAVLVLDVGSRLASGFFQAFWWPDGVAAVQAWLRGTTVGMGTAVALSETSAQRWQDRGREALDWSVRLRGTGTVFAPDAFLKLAPRLRTAVEDTEATLLSAAAGGSTVLSAEGAAVHDVKPERPPDAAGQRARWLLGQIVLLALRAPALLRLTSQRPLEGLAFTAELLSRPLVLSLAGRLALAAAWGLATAAGWAGGWGWAIAAGLAAASLAELPLARVTTGRLYPELLRAAAVMLRVWLRALLRLPAATRCWLSGHRRGRREDTLRYPCAMCRKVLLVVGTRPEAIKLAPVVRELSRSGRLDPVVVATSQHREMLRQALTPFGIEPDVDLGVMTEKQTPTRVAREVLARLEPVLQKLHPAWTVVQGDTTSALAAAVASFYAGVPVAHVEAGLRTGRLDAPFPEEFNRRAVAVAAAVHFAPTHRAAANLEREGFPRERIVLTGNTVVDAVHWIFAGASPGGRPERPTILVTLHRRESFGEPLARVLRAIRTLAEERRGRIRIVYPVHPNPNVRGPAYETLAGLPGVELVPPMHYPALLRTLAGSRFALTDSGGIQEEAPSVGVPVLVARETTERPEVLDAGWARLVGTDPKRILAEARRLLDDDCAHRAMASGPNPFGDGRAAARIAATLAGEHPEPWEGGARL